MRISLSQKDQWDRLLDLGPCDALIIRPDGHVAGIFRVDLEDNEVRREVGECDTIMADSIRGALTDLWRVKC